MYKRITAFAFITLISMSAFAAEPPTDSTAMFDCAVVSGLAKLPNQKTYITAGLFLYDNEHGVKSWSNWQKTQGGKDWVNSRKVNLVEEINSWGTDKEVVVGKFQQKVKDCDLRYGLINKKTPFKPMGMKLGYIKDPMATELPDK